ENLDGGVTHLRVVQTAQQSTHTEHAHMDPQAGQRLAQLQADDARTVHGHAAGQVCPVEHVVVDHQAIARALEHVEHHWRGSRCDHDALCVHFRMAIDIQNRVGLELRESAQFVFFGIASYGVE